MPEYSNEQGLIECKPVEVIRTVEKKGNGTEDDPMRFVVTYWTKKGDMLCKIDPAINADL